MKVKNVIGVATPRIEGERKVTGEALYSVDITLPGMLWGKVLRSPIPYGRIKSINVARAVELPGVRAVLTGKDVAGLRIGRRIYDMPILAEDCVRFVGEKVAAVAAEDESIAELALSLIDVEYEPWEPLLDPLKALEPGAPLLHPDVVNYRGLPHPLQKPSNAFIQMHWTKGDVEAGFRRSDIVISNAFTTSQMHQAYLEPHSCLVNTDASGSAEIWACSKVPYPVREQVANALNIPQAKLLIHPCFIGGDFGGKGDFMDVALAYCLSQRSGRPVKIVMDYEEEFIAANPRHASIVTVKTGVGKDGVIISQHVEIIYDSGAYAAFKPLGYLTGAHACLGPYRIPNVLIEEKIVYTNTVPCGHMRGPGDPQGFFAHESQLDIVARKLGMDRIELRRKNLMVDGEAGPTGETIAYIKTHDTLENALVKSGYFSPKKEHVGRGVALTHWVSNGGQGSVSLRIDEEGRVTLSSAMLDQGSGGYTVLCEIVAEELKIPLKDIRVEVLNTNDGVKDTGVGASRATRVYGNACYDAACKAREEIFRQAAQHLDCAQADLLLVPGAVLHKRAERKLGYGELVRALAAPITVQGSYDDMSKIYDSPMCAQVAEVAVDPETGTVTLLKLTSAHDTGTVLNPLMHQGQIDGGAVMGMGYALMEHLMIEEGKVVTVNFGDYKIPSIKDIPHLVTSVSERPKGPGPYNSMSIGEMVNIPVAAAVANAIEDAVGVRIKSLPITAEKILDALTEKKHQS